MSQDELRKRAKEVLLAHSTKQSVTEHEVDAMLAFAAERVAAERERCIQDCRDVYNSNGDAMYGALSCVEAILKRAIEKGASDAAA